MKQLIVALAVLSLLGACGKKDEAATTTTASTAATAPATAPATTPAPAAAPSPTAELGKSIYGKTCAMCHAAGVAGAPKPGDKADWAPRIAQGTDTLHKHAIEGFTGAKGMMPARGGGASLTDEQIKAAVDFMVAQSK